MINIGSYILPKNKNHKLEFRQNLHSFLYQKTKNNKVVQTLNDIKPYLYHFF